MRHFKGGYKWEVPLLNFAPNLKSKQALIGQNIHFQCLHWLATNQNKQKGGKFDLDTTFL